jgi:hypothetical protein
MIETTIAETSTPYRMSGASALPLPMKKGFEVKFVVSSSSLPAVSCLKTFPMSDMLQGRITIIAG